MEFSIMIDKCSPPLGDFFSPMSYLVSIFDDKEEVVRKYFDSSSAALSYAIGFGRGALAIGAQVRFLLLPLGSSAADAYQEGQAWFLKQGK